MPFDNSTNLEPYTPHNNPAYWEGIEDAASEAAFNRKDKHGELISTETIPENTSLIDFRAFAQEYPEKLFPLLAKLRVEWQEMFLSYYLLGKSQSFIARTHGEIQTRVWQQLRLIEQAIGALIVLGTNPDASILRPILYLANLEYTQYGSLTDLILLYAQKQSYAFVADTVKAPRSAIRKIFRPAIKKLLASKDIRALAVGCYLRSLTHQASLTRSGLSSSCRARLQRVHLRRFKAPPSDKLPLLSFGDTSALRNTSWNMFETSSEHRINTILPTLQRYGQKMFSKTAAQIFAPTDANGELEFGYILARSINPTALNSLTHIRGITEMAATYNDAGEFVSAVTVPHADVLKMMASVSAQKTARVRIGDFVEILTGEAAKYCGTVMKTGNPNVIVEVKFPSGRKFSVTADPTAVRVIPKAPLYARTFYGIKS
jgi:hypothetical protein